MKRINFENAEIVTPAKVTVSGIDYNVTPAVYTEVDKYLSAETLKELQDNTEDEVDRLDENCGTGTDNYSSSSTYAINDIVIYENKIYRCTTAITVAEEFNSSKWVQTSLKDEIARLKGYTNGQQYMLVTISSSFTMSEGSKIPFNTVVTNTTNGKLSLSNNNIVVGNGVTKVRISGAIFNEVQTVDNGRYTFAVLKWQGVDLNNCIVPLCGSFITNTINPKIQDVTSGNIIYLFGDCTGNSIARAGQTNTYLLAEIVE